MPDDRTLAEIEADIARRRRDLAATLDEIAVRLHPQTLVNDAKAQVLGHVDRTVGRVFAAVETALTGARRQFVTEDGTPRLERVVPVALAAVAVGALAVAVSRRRR